MLLSELLNIIDPDNGVYIYTEIMKEYFPAFHHVPIDLMCKKVTKIGGTETEHGECVYIEIID